MPKEEEEEEEEEPIWIRRSLVLELQQRQGKRTPSPALQRSKSFDKSEIKSTSRSLTRSLSSEDLLPGAKNVSSRLKQRKPRRGTNADDAPLRSLSTLCSALPYEWIKAWTLTTKIHDSNDDNIHIRKKRAPIACTAFSLY